MFSSQLFSVSERLSLKTNPHLPAESSVAKSASNTRPGIAKLLVLDVKCDIVDEGLSFVALSLCFSKLTLNDARRPSRISAIDQDHQTWIICIVSVAIQYLSTETVNPL
jgi:hypothetical protein